MKKICLINVWMGKLPSNFHILLRSIQCNPTIDFYFVTDQEIDNKPSNVYVVHSTLEKVKNCFEEKLQMKIKLKYPYKLCDYKPIWYCLIPEVIDKYDFYGHCDADVVFGDIRSFITDEILEQYDKIFDVGFFTLYKCDEKVKEIYKLSMSKENMAYPYKRAFRTNYACYFDEYMGMNILGWQYLRVFRDQLTENIIQDFGWQKLNFMSYITKESFVFKWENGRLFRYNVNERGIIDEEKPPKEYMMVHIQKRIMEIDERLMDMEALHTCWIYPNCYNADRPEGPLYDEKKCAEYAEMIRKSDNKKRVQNLKRYGILDYIPHYFISRRIKRFIVNVKKFY